MPKTRHTVAGALGVLVALGLVVLFYPVFQTLGYALLVKSPATLFWGAIGLGIVGAGWHYDRRYVMYGGLAVVVVFAILIGPWLSGIYAQQDIITNQEFEQRADLPETSQDHVRILPRNVADRYAQSANQLPKYRTGDSDIAYHDGEYVWSYGITPDRLAVKILGDQWGAFYVDMERADRQVVTNEQTMDNGMGVLFTDSYGYRMNLKRPLVDHRPNTAFVFEHGGETYIAQSYVTHKWGFRFAPLPQPYAVPHYGGTLVIDSEGNIVDLSPQEVADSKQLEGQNTYPYQLARFRMTAAQLRNGIVNKYFVGEGVPQIADTGGFSDNKQPFVVPTGGENATPSLTYYIAASPASSGDGIYQVYTLNGQTGDIEYVEFESTQAGPQKAAGYTRSQNRAPNWAANNDDGSTQITEPIPVVVDGTLYWHMRVTPTDGSQISYTTFVNADTGTVYRAESTDAIYEFIQSGGEQEIENSEPKNTPQGVVSVIVLDSNGSVSERVEVTSNQTVRIQPTNSTTTTA